MRSIRDYQRAVTKGTPIGLANAKAAVLRHRFWSAVAGADIPLNATQLGGGLLLPHPNGVVIHPLAVLGPNCIVFQQVTIGTGAKPGVPTIGGAVEIGPGAKILGGISVGDGATIGANALVTHDVPAGAVVGAARAVPRDSVGFLAGTPRR